MNNQLEELQKELSDLNSKQQQDANQVEYIIYRSKIRAKRIKLVQEEITYINENQLNKAPLAEGDKAGNAVQP